MKICLRYRWGVCVLLAALTGVFAISCGGTSIIAMNGKSPYAIVLSASPSASERHAAEELKTCIARATGAELPVVADTDTRAKEPPRIFVGFGEAASKQLAGGSPVAADSLGDEGFIIRTVKSGRDVPDIVIAGGRLRGTMYGVYTFLDHLGFRWYTPQVTRIPEGKTLRIGSLNEKTIPVFMYREPSICEAHDNDWAARNRVNMGFLYTIDDTHGGSGGGLGVHTFDMLIPTSLFREHPEYFPLIGGKRVTGYVQRCLTNPEVVEIAAKNLIAWMDKNPTHHVFDLSQNDAGSYCECPACKKIMEEEGAPSGLYITFVNKVAEIVEKKYPENYVSTLAYSFTVNPPKTVKPRKNVIIRLCPIGICASHPLTECSEQAARDFRKNLEDWSKLTDRIFIWHYAVDFAEFLMPFPDFREFSQAIKTYAKSGVNGIFIESSDNSFGSADADLRAWVMARLLWNPNDNPDSLVTEWMRGVYGKAAPTMRAYFDLIHSRVAAPDAHLHIFNAPGKTMWPDAAVASMDSLFVRALALAEGDSIATRYVSKNYLAVKYLKIALNTGRLELAGDQWRPAGNTVTLADCDAFIREARETGITTLGSRAEDCDTFTLLRQRLETHQTVRIGNTDLEVIATPDLGGRIVGIVPKKTGVNILSGSGPWYYLYPASGGYAESTDFPMRCTGFSNPYKAEVSGRTLTLTGKGNNGLVFRRTVTLPERGSRIEISSSITNGTNAPIIARLRCKMELAADPDSATVLAGATEEKAVEFYRDGAKKPAGEWSVKIAPGSPRIVNRFPAGSVESCHLAVNMGYLYSIRDLKAKTVSMEVNGFEHELAPGKNITMKQVWEIGN